MKRYTPEQLSRILTAHANGLLRRGGRVWNWSDAQYGCANQFAYNEYAPALAFEVNVEMAERFDEHYLRDMTSQMVLRLLEAKEEVPSGDD